MNLFSTLMTLNCRFLGLFMIKNVSRCSRLRLQTSFKASNIIWGSFRSPKKWINAILMYRIAYRIDQNFSLDFSTNSCETRRYRYAALAITSTINALHRQARHCDDFCSLKICIQRGIWVSFLFLFIPKILD